MNANDRALRAGRGFVLHPSTIFSITLEYGENCAMRLTQNMKGFFGVGTLARSSRHVLYILY